MEIDWGDGDYERTAADLVPAAEALVGYAGVSTGDRVLDVGCGTGNAALVAASAGASVTGVDPSESLLEIARDRAAVEDLDIAFLQGSAESLPVPNGLATIALSVFGVIFADDPAGAVSEMRRATRGGGTVAFTTWRPTGAIAAIGDILFERAPRDERSAPKWGDDEWVEELLTEGGLERVEIVEATLAFRSDSPEAFFARLESDHPVWRTVMRTLSDGELRALRAESLAALREGNEDPHAFRATSTYTLVRARVPPPADDG